MNYLQLIYSHIINYSNNPNKQTLIGFNINVEYYYIPNSSFLNSMALEGELVQITSTPQVIICLKTSSVSLSSMRNQHWTAMLFSCAFWTNSGVISLYQTFIVEFFLSESKTNSHFWSSVVSYKNPNSICSISLFFF